jgi:type I restriction enzyme S subunit
MIKSVAEMKGSWTNSIPPQWDLSRVKNEFNIVKGKINIEKPVVLTLARAGIKIRDVSKNEGQVASSYSHYNPVTKYDLLLNVMDLKSGANCNMSLVEGCISPAYANLRAKKGASPKFYDYFFKTQYWTLMMFAFGKGVSYENRWTMNNETLKNYHIPKPEYKVQLLITKFLDRKTSKIEELINLQEISIERLEEYKQSIVTEVVTKGLEPNVEMKESFLEFCDMIPKNFEEIRFKFLVKLSSGLSIAKAEYTKEGVDYLHYGDIHSNTECCLNLTVQNLPKIPFKYKDRKKSAYLEKGDLVFCDTSEDLEGAGKHIYVKSLDGKFVISGSHTIISRKKTDFDSAYISYLFRGAEVKSEIESRVYGIKVYSMSQSILKDITVTFPPIAIQQQIADYLDNEIEEINQLIQIKKDKIVKLNEYKKSLIYEAVTGKIEVM